MKEKTFIETVAKRIKEGMCDLFVGAGISADSNIPTWSEFLEPFLTDLDIKIKDEDDLPLLAQYIVNNNSGNRNIITNEIHNVFGKDYPINKNHKVISRFPISAVWTTNYDNLLEKAFIDRNARIIISEETLLHPYKSQELDIIKLHGDAQHAAKGIVLTKDDYDNYLYKTPMLAQRLRETIINRSILFIGYSYRDPNIQNIMVQASQMKSEITNPHFILLSEIEKRKNESDDDFKQRKIRFEFWVSELNRIGINELIVPKCEINNILTKIEESVIDKTIYVTGTHNATQAEKDAAKDIGKNLSELDEAIINCGQSTGIGNSVMSSFMQNSINKKQDLNKRMRLYPNPYAISPEYANDSSLLPSLRKARIPLISSSKIIMAFQGGMGTKTEIKLALEKDKLIIPIVLNKANYNNDVIKAILKDTNNKERLNKYVPQYYSELLDNKVPDLKSIFTDITNTIFKKNEKK